MAVANGRATRPSAGVPIAALARDPETGRWRGRMEREVQPRGPCAAGHPREPRERALLVLDPAESAAREVPGGRPVSVIDPQLRDLVLAPELRARFARR